MPQILYSGPRDELCWDGITFRRGEITTVRDEMAARRLASLEGFVILPDQKRGPGRPRKADVEDGR